MSLAGERQLEYLGRVVDQQLNTSTFTDFAAVTDYLLRQPAAIALLDSDNTIRNSLQAGLRFRFGEIPTQSIENIHALVQEGWEVAIVSNQRKAGHQIARMMAEFRGYPFFPDSLEAGLGHDRIFAARGAAWSIYKRSPYSISDVAAFISSLEHTNVRNNGIYMVGDKDSDGEFLARLGEQLPTGTKLKFCKLPDPPWIMRIAF